MRWAWIAPVTLLVLGVAACTLSGDSSRPIEPQGPAASPNPVLIDPAAALSASVVQLSQTSGVGTAFTWSIERDGFKISGGGDLDAVAPDDLHLKADYKGNGEVPARFSETNESEILVFGQEVYVKSSVFGEDWILFAPDLLGADWDVLQRLMAARSPVNYAATIASLTQLQDMGDEELDDGVYRHYRGTTDAAAITAALADAYGSQGQVMLVNRFSGPIPVDIWIDRVSLLPHSVKAEGVFEYLGEATDLALTLTFDNYGEAIVLPAAPEDVRSIGATVGS